MIRFLTNFSKLRKKNFFFKKLKCKELIIEKLFKKAKIEFWIFSLQILRKNKAA